MLLFCPACGNVLVAEEGPRCHRFACTTCPYVRNVTRKVPGGGRGSRRARCCVPGARCPLPCLCLLPR